MIMMWCFTEFINLMSDSLICDANRKYLPICVHKILMKNYLRK